MSEERYSWDAGIVVGRKKFGRSFDVGGAQGKRQRPANANRRHHINKLTTFF